MTHAALASAIDAVFVVFTLLVIARVVLSWIPITARGGSRAAFTVLLRATDWFLGYFRRFVPTIAGIDPSPAVAVLALGLVRTAIAGALA